jgi:hypothetical protein
VAQQDRRQQIARLREQADRLRRMAEGFTSMEDVRKVRTEANDVDQQADKLEVELRETIAGVSLPFDVIRPNQSRS